MTPADNPGRRAADGSDVPEPRVSAPAPERSLWAKADLLDPAANRRPRPTDTATGPDEEHRPGHIEYAGAHEAPDDGELPSEPVNGQAERRPDGAGRRLERPQQPLWRKAEALDNLIESTNDGGRADVERGSPVLNPRSPSTPDRPVQTDAKRSPSAELLREGNSRRILFPIHERKSAEIIERERPLVTKVAEVVKRHIDSKTSQEWDAIQGRDRRRAISDIADDIRDAMDVSEIRVRIVNGQGAYGSYRNDHGVHRLEIGKNLARDETLATIVHEIRHAYQAEVVEGIKPNHPDADDWDRNDQRYIDYSEHTVLSYFTQPLEADAYGFERAVGKTLGLDWPDL